MKQHVLAAALVAALNYSVVSQADDRLVRFDGGIGVIPVATATGDPLTPVLNNVRGMAPGGFPWVIERLAADVRSDGRIVVDGRGLLLAGGAGIGTAGGQAVHATLFCGPAAAPSEHGSGAVPLEANGDFRIDDVLDPPPPSVCDTPVLLILNGGNRWFAAGIPKP
ncbi:MAG TPA: hypothetical protein VFV74_09120 [Burkholderiales bacterium]|nr:hypothetical protein [Burkholderiales bacterium]